MVFDDGSMTADKAQSSAMSGVPKHALRGVRRSLKKEAIAECNVGKTYGKTICQTITPHDWQPGKFIPTINLC
jgi:hypothetical protein